MQFFNLVALFAAAALVSAAPTARDDIAGEVYLCSGQNWTGECKDIVFELARCQLTSNILDSSSDIGSIGPNALTECYGFKTDDCSGGAIWGFEFPGEADAGITSIPWTNMNSLICNAKSS